ncbi:unnamed protein product [Cylicocyclus nassatus]|uniref:Uncharacterized protein n=1 Tax=Cylicocyclus nassatus TaxID=53992 RepID=A0AA36GZW6_CYLNA|nr:unnamed protein product [Cylicocyclus nassatus]
MNSPVIGEMTMLIIPSFNHRNSVRDRKLAWSTEQKLKERRSFECRPATIPSSNKQCDPAITSDSQETASAARQVQYSDKSRSRDHNRSSGNSDVRH